MNHRQRHAEARRKLLKDVHLDESRMNPQFVKKNTKILKENIIGEVGDYILNKII